MVPIVSESSRIIRNANVLIGLGSLLWTMTFCPCANSETKNLSERFLREAPPKWREYEVFADRLQGVVRYKSRVNDKLAHDWKYEIKQNRNCKLVSTRYIEGRPNRKSTEELIAYNPDYSFSLKRRVDGLTGGRPWLIASYEQMKDTIREDTESRIRHEAISIFTLVSVQPTIRLSDLVKRPYFHILDAKSVQREGREMVQVKFDSNHPLSDNLKPYCSVQNGVLVLDPIRSWHLVYADLEELWADGRGKCTIENTISEMDGDYPVPRKSVETSFMNRPNGEPFKTIVDYEFDVRVPETLPEDRDFTLSAFGLPELSLPKRPFPWNFVLAGVGVACLIAFFFLRTRAKRLKI